MGAGEIIRQRREELGLSGHELAKLAGVNQGQLSRVETGQLRASAAFCAHVCRALGLNPLELYEGGDGAPVEPPAEDLVTEIRALLIRGRWPPLAREGIVSILRATRPAHTDGEDRINAKKRILIGV